MAPALGYMRAMFKRSISYARMIKLSHTIFALPFALASLVLASRDHAISLAQLGWIIVAMFGARSAAMGFNRLVDAAIDASNPRTAGREIPTGQISKVQVTAFILISCLIFLLAAYQLSDLCFWLAWPTLAILGGYSYCKRFTWLAHIYLGFAIGLAPIAAWIAIAGSLDGRIVILSLMLLSYIAGFDIMYACQDADFDQAAGLFSIPARFGVGPALGISSALHVLSAGLFISLYWLFSLHFSFLIGAAIIAGLFVLEHRLINPQDLSRIDLAFFHVNSVVSVMVLVSILAGEFGRRLA